jgi:preprotein translocase subunit SecG
LIAPAIMVGLRKGWGNILSVIILQFIWFVIILVLYLLLFQSGMNEVIPMPRPLY